MKINLGIYEIQRYLKNLQTDDIAQGETNAFRYFEIGRQKALKDVLNLIEVFGERFMTHLRAILGAYSKTLHPNNDGDRSNADTYLLDGYRDVIKKFISVR